MNISNRIIIDEFNEFEKTYNKNNDRNCLIYYVKEEDIDKDGYVSIFGRNENGNGTDFVKENKEKVTILINNEEKNLEYKYKLRKGENKIRIIVKDEEIFNLEYMFYQCTSLYKIDGLKHFDTKNVKKFSNMFYGCNSLLDIKPLENWNV